MYSFKILSEVDPVKWNSDLMKSGYATFFQTAEYLTSEPNRDYFPIFVYVFDENGEVVGQLGLRIIKTVVMYSSPLFRRFLKIISKITSRGIWLYGPIIHSTDKMARMEILANVIKANDEILEKYDLVHIEGQTPPYDLSTDENYKQEFRKNHYTIQDNVTFLADLTKSIDEIWSNVTKKARGDVNRAKRRNIVIKEMTEYSQLKDYLALNQEWAKTKGIVITDPLQEIERLWSNHNTGLEKFFLAYQDEKLIAGLRVACFHGIAYTNFVINSYLESTNLGGTLLTWSAIEWAKKSGIRIYDFSGGPQENFKDDEEIEQHEKQKDTLLYYKKKWGGDEFPYYVLIKARKKYTYKLYVTLFSLVRFYHNSKMKQFKKSTYYDKDNAEN